MPKVLRQIVAKYIHCHAGVFVCIRDTLDLPRVFGWRGFSQFQAAQVGSVQLRQPAIAFVRFCVEFSASRRMGLPALCSLHLKKLWMARHGALCSDMGVTAKVLGRNMHRCHFQPTAQHSLACPRLPPSPAEARRMNRVTASKQTGSIRQQVATEYARQRPHVKSQQTKSTTRVSLVDKALGLASGDSGQGLL